MHKYASEEKKKGKCLGAILNLFKIFTAPEHRSECPTENELWLFVCLWPYARICSWAKHRQIYTINECRIKKNLMRCVPGLTRDFLHKHILSWGDRKTLIFHDFSEGQSPKCCQSGKYLSFDPLKNREEFQISAQIFCITLILKIRRLVDLSYFMSKLTIFST